MNIRFPNITGRTEAEQLVQVKSYLHQLADQLNFALREVETKQELLVTSTAEKTATQKEIEAQDTFTSIKSLIIKSADIVNAYSESIETKLSSVYVAQSAFGEYTRNATVQIQANADSIKASWESLQKVLASVESIQETEAYIKAGLVEERDGMEIYGLEIGQTTTIKEGGNEVDSFVAFARFTSDRLTFFDSYGNAAAWVSQNTFHTPNLEIIGANSSFKLGHLKDIVQSNGSVVTKFVGGG